MTTEAEQLQRINLHFKERYKELGEELKQYEERGHTHEQLEILRALKELHKIHLEIGVLIC
jgi:hypothetical protein